MSLGATCPACGHIGRHPTTAVGRFRPEGPRGYQANGGPLRATRDEAEADCCQVRALRAKLTEAEKR